MRDRYRLNDRINLMNRLKKEGKIKISGIKCELKDDKVYVNSVPLTKDNFINKWLCNIRQDPKLFQ